MMPHIESTDAPWSRRWNARHVAAALLFVAAATPIAAHAGAASQTPISSPLSMLAAPRPVPNLGFEDVRGGERHLAQFRGRVVLLNVWATWCAPCRAEMPTLDRLQSRLGGKDFEVIALSLDDGGAPAVKRFFDEIGVRALAIYVDRQMRAEAALGVVGVPTTLLIDREGREVARKLGPAAWDSPEVAALIRQLEARPGR